MWVSLRRLSAGVVGVVALWAAAEQAAWSQPAGLPAPQGVPNQNIYANPQATAGRFANTAVLGKGLAGVPGTAATGYGSLLPGINPQAPGGYGTLSASYANPGGGYGSLNNAGYGGGAPAGFGMYGGYGLGYGTQWMMNPYEGYLRGAADVTNANAQYQLTI